MPCLAVETPIDRLALFSFALLAALWALAQTSADSANREHVIPLVADGEGIRSRLFVGNASGAVNQCSMELVGEGLDMARFGDHAAVAPDGAFAIYPWRRIRSLAASTGSIGWARMNGWWKPAPKKPAHCAANSKRRSPDNTPQSTISAADRQPFA